MRACRRSLSFLILALAASPLAAQERHVRLAGRDVVIWEPQGAAPAPQALLIFSHGYGGCATQSKFLMRAFAERGYWVVAPNHRDARCGTRGGAGAPEARFRQPEKWNDKVYRDRADDIRAVRAALREQEPYASRMDFGRVGYVGHSLGGYTVLGLAGGWASWRTDDVKAVLALSPYSQPFLAHGTLKGLSAPVMYQGGTLDIGITPWIGKTEGACDASPAPRYCVIFERAGHLAWTDLRDVAHQQIIDYAVAFLDLYVQHAPASRILTHATEGVAELRWKSELGIGTWRPRGR